MRTAYLILFINTRTMLVRAAGIYSESARTMTMGAHGRHFAVDALHATGRDYEEACANLRRSMNNTPTFTWILPLLEK